MLGGIFRGFKPLRKNGICQLLYPTTPQQIYHAYSQLGVMHLIGYLPSHVQCTFVEYMQLLIMEDYRTKDPVFCGCSHYIPE